MVEYLCDASTTFGGYNELTRGAKEKVRELRQKTAGSGVDV